MVKKVLFSLLVTAFIANLCFAPVSSPSVPTSSTTAGARPPSTTSRYANPQYRFGSNNNDIVTGNVGGGRHFRGVVPYGSPYEFGGVQGSSALTDFYRRSSDAGYDYGPSASNRQFYLPSRAVTKIERPQPGSTGISRIDTSRYQQNVINNQINLTRSPLLPAQLEAIGNAARPLAKNKENVLKNLESYLKEYDRLDPDSEKRLFDKDLQKNTLKDKTESTDNLLELPKLPESPFDKFKKDQDTENIDEEKITARDLYEQMLEKADEKFQEDLEQKRLDKIAKDEGEKQRLIEERQKMREKIREVLKQRREKLGGKKEETQTPEEEKPTETKEIKTFTSNSIDRFNKYMHTAEQLMKEGKFYKAADVYSLASAYDHTNPLSYAGRTHALFAAGDYMSAAFYLDRTLKIFGSFALFKIDIEQMIGDWDTVEARIVELKELSEQNDSAELMFLLAYVYHNTSQQRNAKNAIDDALEGLEDNKSAKLLYDAIYSDQD